MSILGKPIAVDFEYDNSECVECKWYEEKCAHFKGKKLQVLWSVSGNDIWDLCDDDVFNN